MRGRLRVGLLLALVTAIGVGCAGDDDDPAPTITSAPPIATEAPASPTSEPRPDETPAAGAQEVTGIVGAIVTATNTIEINQLSGAAVTQVEVTPQTQIRLARGGTASLSDIRPSDRIVAEGAVDGEVMTAARITVQNAVPGASPG